MISLLSPPLFDVEMAVKHNRQLLKDQSFTFTFTIQVWVKHSTYMAVVSWGRSRGVYLFGCYFTAGFQQLPATSHRTYPLHFTLCVFVFNRRVNKNTMADGAELASAELTVTVHRAALTTEEVGHGVSGRRESILNYPLLRLCGCHHSTHWAAPRTPMTTTAHACETTGRYFTTSCCLPETQKCSVEMKLKDVFRYTMWQQIFLFIYIFFFKSLKNVYYSLFLKLYVL